MSEDIIKILDQKLNSFFQGSEQIADVMLVLNDRERRYLFDRLKIAVEEDSRNNVQEKIQLKINAVNSLILFIAEKL